MIKYHFLRESFLFIIKALTNILVTFGFRYEFEKDISFQKGCNESRCRSDLQLLATVLGTSSFFVNYKVGHQEQKLRSFMGKYLFFSIYSTQKSGKETKKLFVSAQEYIHILEHGDFWGRGAAQRKAAESIYR
jgi:hypothetical protein